MTANPITIHENATFDEGLRLIREKKVRRLPVLDDHGRLVGIIAEKDLLYASPSPATSLSIYEINYLLAKLQVREIMKRKVITTTERTPPR
jgi:acetoin utilization protein AcuB